MLYKIKVNVSAKVPFARTSLAHWNFLSNSQDGKDGKGLTLGKIIDKHFQV